MVALVVTVLTVHNVVGNLVLAARLYVPANLVMALVLGPRSESPWYGRSWRTRRASNTRTTPTPGSCSMRSWSSVATTTAAIRSGGAREWRWCSCSTSCPASSPPTASSSRAPEVLRGWVAWAGRRVGLPPDRRQETIQIIDEAEDDFLSALDDRERWGPGKQRATRMRDDGVDLADIDAANAWLASHMPVAAER